MEIWRDIPGYENLYQVSDDGRVRRLWPVLPAAFDAGVRKHRNYLKPGCNNQGRLQVTLSKNSETRRFQVHRLVLLAFAGPCPDGMEGCHGDGDHTNNRLDNLRWDTRQGNRADAIRHGTLARGEVSRRAKLTAQDVRDIRVSSDSERALAAHYGVSQVAIHYIKTRKTWKHV
jgi:HNH endonuclease/NUMOD4 motif